VRTTDTEGAKLFNLSMGDKFTIVSSKDVRTHLLPKRQLICISRPLAGSLSATS